MAFTSIQNGFVAGEVSPSLFGRTDLTKFHEAAFTMRNFFVNYRGGAASRAGTAYVGMCKQGAPNVGGTASNTGAPRDIAFQFSITQGYELEFGDGYMRIKSNGAYVLETAKAVAGITQANPAVFNVASHGYSVGDWLYATGIGGMTVFNGLAWVVSNVVDANHFSVVSLFGDAVNSTTYPAFTSGGTVARLYTVSTPYAAVDLPYMKFTQSADTMTLCCVNQATLTEYPAYELKRLGATNWTLALDNIGTSIAAPTNVVATPQNSTAANTYYAYVVTAVDATTGEESIASAQALCFNNNIAIYAGSNTISWNAVANAGRYNIYKATPSYSAPVPIGSLYGYCGTAFGAVFTDGNITADFTRVPPVYQNPFARGQITNVQPTAGGSGYSQNTIGYTVTTSTGSGFVGAPVVNNGALVAFIVENGGANYAPTDSITITGGAGGSGATVSITVGPSSGTYPSTVAYFQQRKVYGSSVNNPDTYWMSQPGEFANFDVSDPVVDSDAITGTPWAQQVNGLQFLVPMPGGLVILTGKGAWQLSGGNNAAVTPSNQDAQPQAYNGCNNIVPPIVVNYDILYLQAKGSIFRDLSYNFFVNIYTGTDLTVLSNHLFAGYGFSQWAWAEEPYKIAWAVREDGAMLSLTYLKEQDVYAWSRHDTNGLIVGVSSITEPPVDAVYLIVKRYVRGHWVYYAERMDNRDWSTPEDSWCVDCGLSYPMASPAATVTPATANGTANVTSALLIAGGTGYTAPVVSVIDPSGRGAGATATATVVSGAITAINITASGTGYQAGTYFKVTDTTGSGAVAQPVITNNVTFTASASVFSAGNVGSVIRVGGGAATITSYVSGTQVVANITTPITGVVQNDPNNTPVPAVAGTWTLSAPVTSVAGLNHLEGLEVAIVADGAVVANQTVTNGTITLQTAASQVLVGLPFTCQLQTSYLDPPGQPVTSQTKRKTIPSVGVRVEATRGIKVGTNQPDASTQPDNANVPWSGLIEIKERGATVNAGMEIPLYTGDWFINVPSNWDTRGQIALEQDYPLPANILAVVAYYNMGDTSG